MKEKNKQIISMVVLTVISGLYIPAYLKLEEIHARNFNAIPSFLFQILFPIVFGILVYLALRDKEEIASPVLCIIMAVINLLLAYIIFTQLNAVGYVSTYSLVSLALCLLKGAEGFWKEVNDSTKYEVMPYEKIKNPYNANGDQPQSDIQIKQMYG